MAQLALALLGPLRATMEGVPIAGFESQKVRALLVYLALEADCPHTREELAGLLWPNHDSRMKQFPNSRKPSVSIQNTPMPACSWVWHSRRRVTLRAPPTCFGSSSGVSLTLLRLTTISGWFSYVQATCTTQRRSLAKLYG